MNKAILMGRLTRDPEIRYTVGQDSICVARYTLAVDRRYAHNADNNQPTADFINCVAFGKLGEFAQKYLRKGSKIAVIGRIQTGSYTNRNNEKVYTTDIIVEEQEFAESKQNGANNSQESADNAHEPANNVQNESFMNIPDGIDEDLPFN